MGDAVRTPRWAGLALACLLSLAGGVPCAAPPAGGRPLAGASVGPPRSPGAPNLALVRTVRVGPHPYAVAVDHAANRVLVVNRGTPGRHPSVGSVSVLDATTGRLVATTTLGLMLNVEGGSGPQAVAIDARVGHALVLNSGPLDRYGAYAGPGTVALLDVATGRLLRTVRVGVYPFALAVDARRGRAFVLNLNQTFGRTGRGTVSVLATASGALVRSLTVSYQPQALALDTAAARLFVVNGGPDASGVSLIDTARLRKLGRVALPPQSGCGLAVDPARGRVLVAVYGAEKPNGVTLFDAATGAHRRTVPAPGVPIGCADYPADPTLAVDAGTGRALLATGPDLHGYGDDAFSVLDSCSGRMLRTVQTASGPLAVDTRTGHAFTVVFRTSNTAPGTMVMLDLATGAVLGRVGIGRFSWGTGQPTPAVDAATGRVYMPNEADGTLSMLQEAATASIPAGQPTPATPVPAAGCGARYFPPTRHNLAGPLLAFWRRLGGLPVLGYPRSELFHQGTGLAQYTERFLLQLTDGHVTTAPLGRLLTQRQGRAFPRVAPVPSTAKRLYFPQTGHSLSGRFLAYWRAHHGAALLGAPLSEVVVEANGDGSRRRYPVQWFERGRLEYHAAQAGTPYAVQPGLLGVQALQARGWLPLAPE